MNKIKAIAMSTIIAASQIWAWLSNATESRKHETKNSIDLVLNKLEIIKTNCELSDVKVTPKKRWEKIIESFSCKWWEKWEINTNTVNFWKKVEYKWVNYNCSDFSTKISKWNETISWKGSILIWDESRLLLAESCKEINDFNK